MESQIRDSPKDNDIATQGNGFCKYTLTFIKEGHRLPSSNNRGKNSPLLFLAPSPYCLPGRNKRKNPAKLSSKYNTPCPLLTRAIDNGFCKHAGLIIQKKVTELPLSNNGENSPVLIFSLHSLCARAQQKEESSKTVL
ncbi:hypothetical protein CEXT_531201 [Caerostris extrusa]|uniref:Uncharacterized protein n=1 Tax=Caerostris extrusa TaxID=172846 RepID=A0AAV4P1H8_CAEEX|nr:hypothetical protein CEXT_531201 [Caerostris extrusa]